MEIQDGKGNVLTGKTLREMWKQLFCNHHFTNMGNVDACPHCQKVRPAFNPEKSINFFGWLSKP
jgi:hypothetical protein